MNLFYGLLLQIFHAHWSTVAYSLNLLFGLLAYLAIYAILVRHKIATPIALGLVIIAMCNPSAAVYEAEPLYTHTVFCLLIFSAYLFDLYLIKLTPGIGIAFLVVITSLVLWRSSYQVVWYVLCAFWLIKISPPEMRRKMTVLALTFAGLIGSLYLKNGFLLGSFNTSSCSGMSLAKAWTGRNQSADIARLIQEKRLSQISSIPAYSSMDIYQPVIGPLPRTGVPAVDTIFKDNGSLNLNNIGYPEVSKLYARDYWKILKLSPKTIAEQISRGWLDYFRPTSVYISNFDPQNQASVETIDRGYRSLFCLGARNTSDSLLASDSQGPSAQKLLRRLKSVCWQAAFIYAILAMFLVFMPFQRWATGGDRLTRQLLLFVVLNVAYSAFLSNAVEVAENMRYRFETQGLVLIAATIIGCRFLNSFLNSAKPRNSIVSKAPGPSERAPSR